jgi:hypothetical protein
MKRGLHYSVFMKDGLKAATLAAPYRSSRSGVRPNDLISARGSGALAELLTLET